MTRKLKKKFQPGRGYSKKDWDDVSDNPPLTAKEIAAMRPFAEVHPEMAAAIAKKRGRPPVERPKRQVTVRLDADIIDALKADGPGWQTRMNEKLRRVVAGKKSKHA
jgi:uncharacterized protein (DUF4415 family)